MDERRLRAEIADEIDAMATAECGARHDRDDPVLAAHFAERGIEFYPHYPDPGWSYCDGCSSAQSADSAIHAVAQAVRNPSSGAVLS